MIHLIELFDSYYPRNTIDENATSFRVKDLWQMVCLFRVTHTLYCWLILIAETNIEKTWNENHYDDLWNV